jgi:hypothetical protein
MITHADTLSVYSIRDAAALPMDREITMHRRCLASGKWLNAEVRTLADWMREAAGRANAAGHDLDEASPEACLRYLLADFAEFELEA